MNPSAPLCFQPWLRPMPWGGSRLPALLDGTIAHNPIGEAWLLSDHRLHPSILHGHPEATLSSLLEENTPGMMGKNGPGHFPLLIKLLDAQQNLSVQVHPDDELAKEWAPDEAGKTEAWHVLAADPGAVIYLGVKPGIDRKTLQRETLAGNIVLCLERYEPKAGETYYIPAGTVHALGQGLLILEVQQTSDATFRLYDWGRLGPDGQPRKLHMHAGLSCTKLALKNAGLQAPQLNKDGSETLVETPFFTIRRWKSGHTMQVIAPAVVVAWDGPVTWQEDGCLPSGQACLIPARLKHFDLTVSDKATAFEIRWETSIS